MPIAPHPTLKQQVYNTILYNAVRNGDIDTIETFAPYVDLNALNNDGFTLVHTAVQQGNINVLEVLAKHHCNFDALTDKGISPAYLAALCGYGDVIAKLAEYGADLETASNRGGTPAFIAAHEGHLDVLIQLASYGVDLNDPELLFVAVQNGHIDIVSFFLQNNFRIRPYIFSADVLRSLAPEDNDTIKAKIEELIKIKQAAGQDLTDLAITLKEIAHVMGHNDIVKLFSALSPEDYATTQSTLDSHTAISHLGEMLGYVTNKLGLCFGFTMKWLEACILGKEAESTFNQRIDEIQHNPAILEKINLAKAKTKKHETLLPDDREALEVLAFYEQLLIYQNPLKYHSIFDTPVTQSDIDRSSQFAGSDKIASLGGISTLHSAPGIYTKNEIAAYLDALGQTIENMGYPPQTTIGILLQSENHAVGLTYQIKTGWKFMDINQRSFEPATITSTQLIARQIVKAFDSNKMPYVAFNTKVISMGSDPLRPQLGAQLKKLQKEYVITKEISKRQGHSNLAYIATQQGNLDVMIELANLNADFNIKTRGSTPAYAAAKNGYLDILHLLKRYGVNLDDPNSYGETPVFAAAAAGQTATVELLARWGANLNTPSKSGLTPIIVAAALGHVDVVTVLKKYGVNLDTPDNTGTTPILAAAQCGQAAVVARLAQLGANIWNAPSTLVYHAVENGHIAVLIELAKLGLRVNESRPCGTTTLYTSLFVAAKNGHRDMVHYLLEHGCTPMSPSFCEADTLRNWVENQDEIAKEKVEALISLKLNLGENSKNISIFPHEIASIKGFDEIVQLINASSQRVKTSVELTGEYEKQMAKAELIGIIKKHLNQQSKNMLITPSASQLYAPTTKVLSKVLTQFLRFVTNKTDNPFCASDIKLLSRGALGQALEAFIVAGKANRLVENQEITTINELISALKPEEKRISPMD